MSPPRGPRVGPLLVAGVLATGAASPGRDVVSLRVHRDLAWTCGIPLHPAGVRCAPRGASNVYRCVATHGTPHASHVVACAFPEDICQESE